MTGLNTKGASHLVNCFNLSPSLYMHWTASLSVPATVPRRSCCKRRKKEICMEVETVLSPHVKKPLHFTPQLITFTLFGTIAKEKHLGDEENYLMLSRVSDVNKRFPDIPEIFHFGLSTVQFGTVGVFCNQSLNKGAILGPFTGRKLSPDASSSYQGCFWEIHQQESIKYCLDGSDPVYRNWMYFIQYARSSDEQNLTAVQYDERLFFKAERDVKEGEELLVWYDETQYKLYMGIPQGFKELSIEDSITEGEMEDEKDLDEDLSDEQSEMLEIEDDIELEEEDETTLEFESEKQDDTESNDGGSSHGSSPPSLQSHIYSPIFPRMQFSPSVSTASNNLFTVYPFPSVHNFPWLKQPSQSPSSILSMPLGWPGTQRCRSLRHHSCITPPSHMNKASSLDMFVRGVDGTRWQCQICSRIFTSQGSLRAHARIHTGEKPYQCKFCQRKFTQASTLRSHERLHTGERPYKCSHCGKSFTQSAGLRSHNKTHITR